VVVGVGALLYANALSNGLVWDDRLTALHAAAHPGAALTERTGSYYRPLVMLSFALDARLWGGSPAGFHLTNVACHVAVAWALTLRFLVDTGAVYTVLPEHLWRGLHLEPERRVEFTLADGTTIVRPVSQCEIQIGAVRATSPVVLGEANEGPLLGAVSLETLGLMVSPLSRELLPMRLVLAQVPR
jgi:predicted aspartyl protease